MGWAAAATFAALDYQVLLRYCSSKPKQPSFEQQNSNLRGVYETERQMNCFPTAQAWNKLCVGETRLTEDMWGNQHVGNVWTQSAVSAQPHVHTSPLLKSIRVGQPPVHQSQNNEGSDTVAAGYSR